MNTNATSLIDTFDLCTKAVIEESSFFQCPTFDDSHCKTDSRDEEFDRSESRLAYLNKFGYFNIKFSEKCISSFLNEYSDSDNTFPHQNLKVCSLSNGPGLDLVGLLCALNNCNKVWSCPPEVKAVNLYDSWLRIYLSILGKTYQAACQKLYSENVPVIYKNVQFIQSDIFADMSPEAEKFISNSNVLLMFRAFYSTKANADVQNNTLKKIFSLVKPGTLIFFTGSKNNFKNFSNCSLLNSSVKCLFGPQKVKLENLSYPEFLIDANNIKPQDSGHSEFVVWQRRENDVSNSQTTSKKRSRRRKKKILKAATSLCSENITTGSIDDTDVESEMSYSSCSKQSESSESSTYVLNSNAVSTVNKDNSMEETLKKLRKIECGICSANAVVLDNPTVDNNAIKEIKDELQKIEHKISLVKADFSILDRTVSDNPAIDNNDAEETLNALQRVECEISSIEATVSVLDEPAIDNNGTEETQSELQRVDYGISSTKASVSVLDKDDNPAINECFQLNVAKLTDETQHNNLENTVGKVLANHILEAAKITDPTGSAALVTTAEVTENKILSNIHPMLEHIIIPNDKLEFKDSSLKKFNTITDQKLKATSLSNSNTIVGGKLDFQDTSLKNGCTMSGVKLEFKGSSSKISHSEKESEIDVLAKSQSVEKVNLTSRASIIEKMEILSKMMRETAQNSDPKLTNSKKSDFVHIGTSFKKIKCPEEVLSPLKQKKVSAKAAENVLVKNVSKINKIQSLKANDSPKVSLRAVNKNTPQAAAQNEISAVNRKNKSMHNLTSNVAANNTCMQNLNHGNNYDVKALIQRCENLVTVLEKVTVDIKSEIHSRCNEYTEKSCCRAKPHTKFCAPRCCACSVVSIMNSCCCSKTFNCSCMKSICSTNCSNSFPCSRIREQCNFERERCDASKPFITIPLQNADILNILSTRKK